MALVNQSFEIHFNDKVRRPSVSTGEKFYLQQFFSETVGAVWPLLILVFNANKHAWNFKEVAINEEREFKPSHSCSELALQNGEGNYGRKNDNHLKRHHSKTGVSFIGLPLKKTFTSPTKLI